MWIGKWNCNCNGSEMGYSVFGIVGNHEMDCFTWCWHAAILSLHFAMSLYLRT